MAPVISLAGQSSRIMQCGPWLPNAMLDEYHCVKVDEVFMC
jgi:hypothetical protein